MTMKKLMCTTILALLALTSAVRAADDDLVVIVNKSNSATNLTKSQLRKLVLGEQGSWPGGAKVTVVLRSPGSPERDGVLKSVCRMSEDDYNQHVMHANFSGDTSAAPKIAPNAAAVRQLVASSPGAVGFLRASDVNDSVKVVSVDGATAGQPDYKIKAGK
jgi:ABC-type phosphate transport system substrate-binding protein